MLDSDMKINFHATTMNTNNKIKINASPPPKQKKKKGNKGRKERTKNLQIKPNRIS